MKRLLQITLFTFLVAVSTTVASAQANDDISATANVIAQINVNGEQALDFGSIAPGATSTVAVTDAASVGRFSVAGNGGTLDLDFNLSNADLTGPGVDIPITFGAGSAAWGADASSPTNTFDPSSTEGVTTALSADPDGTIFVFIGGSITAAADQTAGTYSGTITLTATYN